MALSGTLQIASVRERLHRVERFSRLRNGHHQLARIGHRIAIAVLAGDVDGTGDAA
jgi:hypothetical protein